MQRATTVAVRVAVPYTRLQEVLPSAFWPSRVRTWEPENTARAMGGLTRPAVRKRLSDAAGTVGEWLTDVPDVSRRLGELAGRIVECEVEG